MRREGRSRERKESLARSRRASARVRRAHSRAKTDHGLIAIAYTSRASRSWGAVIHYFSVRNYIYRFWGTDYWTSVLRGFAPATCG